MRRVVLVCALAACGSDDTDTKRESGCELDIVISGGYSYASAGHDPRQLGCGAAGGPTGASIGVELYGPADNDIHGASVAFNPPIAMAQTGDVPVTVEVEADDDDITRSIWESAPLACTFSITKNEFTEDDFFTNKYLIGGTVSCPAALTPDADTTLPAITVNAFTFVSFVDFD